MIFENMKYLKKKREGKSKASDHWGELERRKMLSRGFLWRRKNLLTTPATLIWKEAHGADKKFKVFRCCWEKKKKASNFQTLLFSQTASHWSLQEQWNKLYIVYYKLIETGDVTMWEYFFCLQSQFSGLHVIYKCITNLLRPEICTTYDITIHIERFEMNLFKRILWYDIDFACSRSGVGCPPVRPRWETQPMRTQFA